MSDSPQIPVPAADESKSLASSNDAALPDLATLSETASAILPNPVLAESAASAHPVPPVQPLMASATTAFGNVRYKRILEIWFFVFALILTFFIAALLKGKGQESASFPTLEVLSGNVSISENLSGTETVVGQRNLPHETELESDEDGTGILSFPGNGAVRFAADSKLSFLEESPSPLIFLEKGAIWVFAAKEIRVQTPYYDFIVAAGSAGFSRNDTGVLKVLSWDNSLKTALRTSGRQNEVALFVPPLSQALFPETIAQDSLENIVERLRFSKILKEFHIARAQPQESDHKNIWDDRLLRQELAERILRDQGGMPSWISRLFGKLRFFKQTTTVPESTKTVLYQAAQRSDFITVQITIGESSLPLEFWQEFLAEVMIVEAEGQFPEKKLRQLVEDHIAALDPSTEFPEEMLRNAFHGLQRSFEVKNQQWRDLELERIRTLWNRFESNEQRVSMLLSLHRETLFRLFLENPSELSADLIAFLHFLDTTQENLSELAERPTTTLEIVQKDLTLARTLIFVRRLDLARQLLDAGKLKLAQANFPVLFPAKDNVLKQQENIEIRLYACESADICAEQEFTQWLQAKKIAACQLAAACSAEQFSAWIRDVLEGNLRAGASEPEISEQPLTEAEIFSEVIRQFAAVEITLIEGRTALDGFFEVLSARTKSAIQFSGKFSFEGGYLKEVKLQDGTEIPGILSLSSLSSILERTVAFEETVDPEDPEVDDLSLDPVLADLTIRTVQPELLDAGLIVLRSDMLPKTPNLIIVEKAVVGPDEVAVRFEYVIRRSEDQKVLRNTILFDYPEVTFPEIPLAEAATRILATFSEQEARSDLEQKALDLLLLSGLEATIEMLTADSASRVRFSQVPDLEHNLMLSGVIDVSAKMFVLIEDPLQRWKAENVPVEDYQEIFTPDSSAENIGQLSPEEQEKARQALEDSNEASSSQEEEDEVTNLEG